LKPSVEDAAVEQTAYAAFIQEYPEYRGTSTLDGLRASDYSRLDRQHQIYLDYTGGSFHAESQVRKHGSC
jgi:molybdenum cofactor sulfurtransferase